MPTAMEKGAVKFFNTKELANFPTDIVCEVPLSLYLNGEKISTIACTGLHLRELAVGFFRSEGLLVTRDEIKDVLVVEGPEPAVYVYTSEQNQPRREVNSIAPGGARARDGNGAGLKPFEGVSLNSAPKHPRPHGRAPTGLGYPRSYAGHALLGFGRFVGYDSHERGYRPA